jgi:hypothetical protein
MSTRVLAEVNFRRTCQGGRLVSTTTAPIAVLMAYVCLNPVDDVATDCVDLIEINHFYDELGKHVFDQVIFYDWSSQYGRYNVRAWRLLKRPAQIPQRDWTRGYYVALWHDGIVLRKVLAETVRESWTQYDPELVERAFLPKEQRRELRKLIAKCSSTR